MATPIVNLTTTFHLTNQERRVIFTGLTYVSASLDAEGQPASATTVLELAYRILPGGLRSSEDPS